MKTLLITSTLVLITTALSATELSWVDDQISAIKPPRKASKISNIKNPFVFLEKNGYVKKEPVLEEKVVSTTNAKGEIVKKVIKAKPKPLVLNAILNSSALINGKWYKKNDKIRSYRVVSIDKSSVTLKSGDRRMILSTNTKNKTLKFKNK
jgi:adenine-specific DNA methylase